jgi:hypothetical protein
VASKTERIEQDIQEARNQLANTLDQLSVKANPQKIVDDTRQAVLDTVKQPKILIPVAGVAVVVVTTTAWVVTRTVIKLVFRR